MSRTATVEPDDLDPDADEPGDDGAEPPASSQAPADAPAGALVATPDNPVPAGAVSGYFDGQDLTRLRFARWPGRTDTRIGTVCVFTGRAEYIEKYFETVTDLRARGFHVAMMDWRGQGGSARMQGNLLKGDVTTFDQYIADIDRFMREVVLPDCPGPYYALAHSMGGNIVLQTLTRRVQWFERAVLCAPMLELAGLRMSVTTLRRIAEIACYVGLAAAFVPGGARAQRRAETFDGNPFTSDRRRFERNQAVLAAAPELAIGVPTIGWFHAAARAMEVVLEPEFTPRLTVPTLMVGAGRDQVVSSAAIEDIGSGLRAGGFVIVDGARHEILQERDWLREQFWAAFDAFVPGSGDAGEPDEA